MEGGAEERVEEVVLAGNYLHSHWGSCGGLHFSPSLSLSLSFSLLLPLSVEGARGIIWESLLANSAAASSLPESLLHRNEASWEFLLDAETYNPPLYFSLSILPLLILPLSPFSPSFSQSVTFLALSPLLVFLCPLLLFLFPALSSPFPFSAWEPKYG